jgi:hypothetical protein
MMSDLTERLRAEVKYDELNEARTNMLHEERLFDEAAERIDELEAALREILEAHNDHKMLGIARRALGDNNE